MEQVTWDKHVIIEEGGHMRSFILTNILLACGLAFSSACESGAEGEDIDRMELGEVVEAGSTAGEEDFEADDTVELEVDTESFPAWPEQDSAAPEAPPQRAGPAIATESIDCGEMVANTRKAGGKGVVVCVEEQSIDVVRERLDRNPMRASAVLPIPQWCKDNAPGWSSGRTRACAIRHLVLIVTDLETGAVVGTMHYLEISYSYAPTPGIQWAYQIELEAFDMDGLVAGTMVEASANCSGACVLNASIFASQPMIKDVDAEGEAYFDATTIASGAVGFATTSWTYFFTNPSWIHPSNPVTVSPPRVRCDNATAGTTVGCVFSDFVPPLPVSLTGAAPSYAIHIQNAQASGLPGAYPGGVPLTRLTSGVRRRRNYRTACSRRFPRPAGYSCDEYPYQSTWEGAFTGGGPGRTYPGCQIPLLGLGSGPVGWSACMIPVAENSSGGGSLGAFYRSNRVIEGDPFFVWIIP